MDTVNDNEDNEIMDDTATTSGSGGAKVIYTPPSTVGSSGKPASFLDGDTAKRRDSHLSLIHI